MRFIGVLGFIAGLAGCSSGTDGGAVSRYDAAAALAASLEGENISTPNLLPKKGTASYAGFVVLDLPIGGETSERVGDLDLSVNFAASTDQVTGGISNLDGLGGNLAISGGTIDRNIDPDVDYTFDAAMAGTLTDGTDRYSVDGSIVGEFRGRYQDGITGLVFGDITGPDGQDLFSGALSGTRSD